MSRYLGPAGACGNAFISSKHRNKRVDAAQVFILHRIEADLADKNQFSETLRPLF